MRPRIVSPVDRLSEALPLLEAGVDELYGGVLPGGWRERFGLLGSANQRTFPEAQVPGFDDLAAIVALAHTRGATFSLTLNAPFYSDEQMPLLEELVDEAAAAGIDGVILADLGLLRRLRRRHPQLEYHASTLAHLTNSAAIDFFRRQGISRAVLPRHLTVADMTAIAARTRGVRLDAFLLVGKCPNTEGLCTFHHSSPDRVWPCEIPYRITPLAGGEPSESLRGAMERQGSWATTNRRHGCGLCAIPHLLRSGLWGLKLVGRGAATEQKVRNVLLVRDFIDLAATEPDLERYRHKARAAHRRRFGSACSPNVCYYPEFYQGE